MKQGSAGQCKAPNDRRDEHHEIPKYHQGSGTVRAQVLQNVVVKRSRCAHVSEEVLVEIRELAGKGSAGPGLHHVCHQPA